MNQSKQSRLFLIAIHALAVLLPLASLSSSFAAEPIKVGYSAALTGDYAKSGDFGMKAIKLAVRQINAAGGINGAPIELVVSDNQSTPKGAVASVEELIEKKKVRALIGPLYSAQMVACLPVIQKHGIPTATGATATRVTIEGNKNVFRFRPDDSISAFAMVKYLTTDLKLAKLGILHDSGAFGVGGSIEVNKQAQELGIATPKRIQIDPGAPVEKHKELAEGFKKSGIEAVLSYMQSYEDQGRFALATYQLGRPFILMGTPMILSKPAMEIAKEGGNEVLSVSDAIITETPGGGRFTKAYKAEYAGETPDTLFSWTYDAMTVFANALKKAKGPTAKELGEALFKTEPYEGIYGPLTFDAFGNGVHQVSIVKMDSGSLKLIKVISKAF